MAVTIIKKFWNGTEYKDIAKIVFTSPNFTSPYQAGTRSHMQPGGQYMGTWYEAVDFMYRQRVDQDYASLPDEMESFFGQVTVSGGFDFSTDTTLTVTHKYGNTFDLIGPGTYANILYRDKDNYGAISESTASSGIDGDTIVQLTLTDVVGDAILNNWLNQTTSGTLTDTIVGQASPVGEITTISGVYNPTVVANDEFESHLSIETTIAVSGALTSEANETVSGTLTTQLDEVLEGVLGDGLGTPASSTISGAMSVIATGHDYGVTLSGVLGVLISETMPPIGSIFTTIVSGEVVAYTNDSRHVTISGTVGGQLSGTVTSGAVYPNVGGTISGNMTGNLEGYYFEELVSSDVTGTMNVALSGREHVVFTTLGTCPVDGIAVGPIDGTIYGEMAGNFTKPREKMYHQYSDIAINSTTVIPRPRRHHGGNSILFAVTFGEAYDCRLTAWDDDTHSTTNNKVLAEEHYKVDAIAYRSNIENTAHTPTFRKNTNLVFPPAMDAVLRGNDRYYGDFDLIFSIEVDEYGEYLAFIPRLVDIDDSFIAGSYDFITTLHYKYT